MNRSAIAPVGLALLAALATPARAQDDNRGLAPALDPSIRPQSQIAAPQGQATAPSTGSEDVAPTPSSAAPNGRLLPHDVTHVPEDALLLPGRKAAIYALEGKDGFHPEREPLILVHGIKGDFENWQPLVDRFDRSGSNYQVYLVAYDDWKGRASHNGDQVAAELRRLADSLGPGRDVTLVAHSLGGIITRRAIDELVAGPGKGIEKFGHVRFLSIDSPWHGYAGPADGFSMKLVRPFMPGGLLDMRGKSGLFVGDPRSDDPAERAGLFGTPLPSNVSIRLVFAQEGDAVYDYTESFLKPLPGKIADLYNGGVPVSGEQRLQNYWAALASSEQMAGLDRHLRSLAAAGTLDATSARGALERWFPRYPGEHTTVLSEHPGKRSLLDAVEEFLKKG